MFLVAGDSCLTFADTLSIVHQIAGGLTDIGIRKGDRIAIIMDTRPDYVCLVIAINLIGAIWVPINPEYKGEWLVNAVRDSEPALIVVESAHVARIVEIADRIDATDYVVLGDARGLEGRVRQFEDLRRGSSVRVSLGDVHHGDTSAILWTSGTTGRPKGVMQSHHAWFKAAEWGERIWRSGVRDIAYNCLPLHNSAAWGATIFRCLYAGIPVALDQAFSVTGFWDRVRFYGATQMMSLGAMHIFLLNAPKKADDADNPIRGACLTPMPVELVDAFCARFGVGMIAQGYGQSEVQTLFMQEMTPGEPNRKSCLGTPNPDFEIRLIDDSGQEVPIGVAGEFAVRPAAPNLMFNGYFRNPEATAAAYDGDWFRTGDLGMRDADGDWFFVDRKKDFMRFKGLSVSSFQVEGVARKHPHVAECAAFGIPRDDLPSESEIKLDVVAKPGTVIEPAELARFINDNAPHFIVPRYIEVRETLPYTPTNKIEKYKLRSQGVSDRSWDRQRTDFKLER